MNWYIVDKGYVSYLSKFDYKVGNVEYGEKLKLHIGVLIEIGNNKYYVPVSSPKEKHNQMKNSLDFHKLVDSDDGTLYAVININNMIPVPDKYITQLKYNEIQNYRFFSNQKEKTDYIYLLQKEKLIIDSLSDILCRKAQKLFYKVSKSPNSLLAKRCCNFTLLQEKSIEYNG